MKRIKTEIGPFATDVVVFDAGDRKLFVKLTPTCLMLRAARTDQWRPLPFAHAYTRALGIAADFDTGPRAGRSR